MMEEDEAQKSDRSCKSTVSSPNQSLLASLQENRQSLIPLRVLRTEVLLIQLFLLNQLKKLFSNWEELLIGKPIESKPWRILEFWIIGVRTWFFRILSSDHHDSPSSPHHHRRDHHCPITAIENTTIPSSCKRLGRVPVAERGISGVCKSFPFTQMRSFSLISLKFKRLLSLHFSQPLAPALLTPIFFFIISHLFHLLLKKKP
ncbi:uncharacterized protein LOC103927458 [Pyrus x bretschneideri]|uniref:uncharacterized protein LOC103927458 n=1 Tax=Pyrus x bretschneideri TaxID=225117 RepID=UPI00202E7093|nr:uncharacterized protein LOC103927458 [Pyrus x bretschneideri]